MGRGDDESRETKYGAGTGEEEVRGEKVEEVCEVIRMGLVSNGGAYDRVD